MKRNLSKGDRLIRTTISALLVLLLLSNNILGAWSYVASVAAVYLFITSLLASCPIYSISNLSSLKK